MEMQYMRVDTSFIRRILPKPPASPPPRRPIPPKRTSSLSQYGSSSSIRIFQVEMTRDTLVLSINDPEQVEIELLPVKLYWFRKRVQDCKYTDLSSFYRINWPVDLELLLLFVCLDNRTSGPATWLDFKSSKSSTRKSFISLNAI